MSVQSRFFPRSIFTLALCCLIGGFELNGQEAALDAKTILEKSAEACREIQSIEYSCQQMREGVVLASAVILQARAGVPESGFLPGLFKVTGRHAFNGPETTEMAYCYNGELLRALDPQQKSVLFLKSPASRTVARVLGMAGLMGLRQFSEPAPFEALMKQSEQFEYGGREEVQGTECHIVLLTGVINHPQMGRVVMKTRWFIGTRDFLPRGYESADPGSARSSIRIVRTNAGLTKADFDIPTPAGYVEKSILGNEPDSRGLLAAGTEAPEFALRDPQGRLLALKELRGRVVLLDFWGTWCVPCLKAMPALQRIHEQFKDRGLVVLGVDVETDPKADPAGTMRKMGFTYGLLLGGEATAAAYQVKIFPSVYLIGPDGKILHAESGLRDGAEADLAARITGALKKLN